MDDDQTVEITEEEYDRLNQPSSLTNFQKEKLERFCKKNWDLFYKRNGNRFFKNRYWTKREFKELFVQHDNLTEDSTSNRRYLLEIGCGCGDFALPLLETKTDGDDDDCLICDLFIYCCDISNKAIEILKESCIYKKNNPHRIKAFVADITGPNELICNLDNQAMDIASLIFVLSAIDPGKMSLVVENLSKVLKPGGLVLFRDYAKYDKAMLRFGKDSKISDQFYVRQDGTRAYFFTKDQLLDIFNAQPNKEKDPCGPSGRAKFHCQSIEYVRRETVNNATKAKYARVFLQAKFTLI